MKRQTAAILAMLRERGVDGVSDEDARSAPAYCHRVAARIHELRAEGYDILAIRERHRGGSHSRYVLREPRPVPTVGVQEGLPL